MDEKSANLISEMDENDKDPEKRDKWERNWITAIEHKRGADELHIKLCPFLLILLSGFKFIACHLWVKSSALGKMLGEGIGDFIEVDDKSVDEGWGPYLRIRVSIDVSKPLLRGKMIELSQAANGFWVDLWISPLV